MKRSPANVVASCVALSAFTVAILAGLSSENPATAILGRAFIAMVICYPVGLLAGTLTVHVIDQHFAARRGEANAVPEGGDDAAGASDAAYHKPPAEADTEEEALVV